MGHLNINSLRNKFEILREIVHDKWDILLISKIRANPSFSSYQFAIDDSNVPFQPTQQ